VTVRVGVDVGGTFTKAVAFDIHRGQVVKEAIVPTTHTHVDGVAAGVVEVVAQLAHEIDAANVELVTHSTTQAVNALLEGDVAMVGMIGMGRAPDLRKARKRTIEPRIELSEGRTLATVPEFLDVTGGLEPATAREAVERVRARGAEAVAVAEAFAPDDVTNEVVVAAAAEQLGLPVTTSAELSGLYGLELRAVTAALNASILPIALRTAQVVGDGVAGAGVRSAVMVMRGDGGATDLGGFRRAPARTLYSGPAASVAGALRSNRIDDGVIVEVGGTSTNVAPIRHGRPALSYVQVASHATAIRALDVRVLGVAGGSMLRSRRNRVYGVGPRSAHIAGLPYACFLRADDFEGATTDLVSPRPGDPADHLVVRLMDGRAVALTNTCAANVLGVVQPEDYAAGDHAAARAAFAIAGRLLRLQPEEVARRMLQASTQAVGDLVSKVMRDHHLGHPVLVAVGGGAGALGRAVASAMGLDIVVPAKAEVISAVGDALSLVRAERERTMDRPTSSDIERLVAEVEGEALAAGAAASTLDVRVENLPERSAVRAVVTGAVALSSGAVPGRQPATASEADEMARGRGYGGTEPVGQYWIATTDGRRPRVVALDRYGDVAVEVDGVALRLVSAEPSGAEATIAAALEENVRRVGPAAIAADAWVISGSRFLQVPKPDADTVLDTVRTVSGGAIDQAVVIIGRE
jgi:N-methylhydantoinase A/oxoprolinase/acetone carboxylase beta subunit